MDTPMNSSGDIIFSELPAISPLHRALMILVFIPLLCLTVLGNALVILACWRDSALKTPHYNILASLALSDLLNGVIAAPIDLFSRIILNTVTCSRIKSGFFNIGHFVFCALSITHLILVSSDRLLALLRPLRYVAMVTARKVLVAILFLWVVCISYGISYLVDVANDADDKSLRQFCTGVRDKDAASRRFYTATGVLILLVGAVLFILNLRILSIARRSCRRIQQCHRPRVIQVMSVTEGVNETSSESADHRHGVRESFRMLKATRTISLVVGFFCITWFTPCVWFIIRTRVDISHVGQILIFEIVFFFTNLSSTANPFIYCFKDDHFRCAFCKIIPRLRKYLSSAVATTCGNYM